jgi:transposase InsO family protein
VDRGPTPNQHQVRVGGGVLHQHHPSLWVPNSIITDNGTQFTRKKFLDFCEDHHIRVDWAAIAHPMTRIYNDLNKFGKWWMKKLPSVV